MEPAPTTSTRIDPRVFERAARVIRILGHPLRLRILESLEDGERNVTDLQDELAATQAAISQQLAILRSEDVVASRREGARVFYRIIEPKVSRILDCIRECDLPERSDLLPIAAFAVLGTGAGDERDDLPGPPDRRPHS
jgi:DNA-binding transcriptional ArsR family regulator